MKRAEYNCLYADGKYTEPYSDIFFTYSHKSSKDFYGESFIDDEKTTLYKKNTIYLDDKIKENSIKIIIINKPIIFKEKSGSKKYPERIKLLKEELKILSYYRKYFIKKRKKIFS